jgi:hypothetical protein
MYKILSQSYASGITLETILNALPLVPTPKGKFNLVDVVVDAVSKSSNTDQKNIYHRLSLVGSSVFFVLKSMTLSDHRSDFDFHIGLSDFNIQNEALFIKSLNTKLLLSASDKLLTRDHKIFSSFMFKDCNNGVHLLKIRFTDPSSLKDFLIEISLSFKPLPTPIFRSWDKSITHQGVFFGPDCLKDYERNALVLCNPDSQKLNASIFFKLHLLMAKHPVIQPSMIELTFLGLLAQSEQILSTPTFFNNLKETLSLKKSSDPDTHAKLMNAIRFSKALMSNPHLRNHLCSQFGISTESDSNSSKNWYEGLLNSFINAYKDEPDLIDREKRIFERLFHPDFSFDESMLQQKLHKADTKTKPETPTADSSSENSIQQNETLPIDTSTKQKEHPQPKEPPQPKHEIKPPKREAKKPTAKELMAKLEAEKQKAQTKKRNKREEQKKVKDQETTTASQTAINKSDKQELTLYTQPKLDLEAVSTPIQTSCPSSSTLTPSLPLQTTSPAQATKETRRKKKEPPAPKNPEPAVVARKLRREEILRKKILFASVSLVIGVYLAIFMNTSAALAIPAVVILMTIIEILKG